MIRSCDLTAITIEIGRASANIKPAPQVGRDDGLLASLKEVASFQCGMCHFLLLLDPFFLGGGAIIIASRA